MNKISSPSNNYGLPFSVKELFQYFPGWEISGDFENTGVLFTSEDDYFIKLSVLDIQVYESFAESVDSLNLTIQETIGDIDAITGNTKSGLSYQSFETYFEDTQFEGAINMQAPYFKRLYFSYKSPHSLQKVFEGFQDSFPWNIVPHKNLSKFKTLPSINKALKIALPNNSDLVDNINNYLCRDSITLDSYDLRELAVESRDVWPILIAIVNYTLDNHNYYENSEEAFELISLFQIDGINDPITANRLMDFCSEHCRSFDIRMGIARYCLAPKKRDEMLKSALASADSFYELEEFISSPLFNLSYWPLVKKAFDKKVKSADFSSNNPMPLICTAYELECLDIVKLLQVVKNLSNLSVNLMPRVFERLSQFLFEHSDDFDGGIKKDLEQVRKKVFKKESVKLTELSEIVEFKDSLEEMLEWGLENTSSFYSEFTLMYSEQLDQQKILDIASANFENKLDQICQCAMLVAAADSIFSEDELEEIGEVRPFIRLFMEHEEVVNTFLETGDVEQAKVYRPDSVLHHDISLLEYEDYIVEIIEKIERLTAASEIKGLIQHYSSNIDNLYEQRIALWAAEEICSVEGLNELKRRALKLLASYWGISISENRTFFKNVIYPATDDEYDFTPPDTVGLRDSARELDQLVKSDGEDSELFSQILGEMEVDSFDDLVSLVNDENENENENDNDDLIPNT